MMVDVSVKVPELETLKLENLRRGDTFMLPNKTNSYILQSLVYMHIGNMYDNNIDCVCLNDGTTKKMNCRTQVLRLRAKMQCEYMLPNDDGDLPF